MRIALVSESESLFVKCFYRAVQLNLNCIAKAAYVEVLYMDMSLCTYRDNLQTNPFLALNGYDWFLTIVAQHC